jgi:molybdenum cofactor cytidylyltransferase
VASISAVLTAAGESTRMGEAKPLLAWRGATLLEHQLNCLLEGGVSEVLVVLGHQAAEIARYAKGPNVRWVVNGRYRDGKASSIKAGLTAISQDAEAIVLLAVDQPRTSEIVSQVIRAHVENDALITSPRYRGHGGHPLIFSGSLKSELESITEEAQGIRAVFRRHGDQVTEVQIDDPLVRLDLNTPDAYEEAVARYGE